MHIKVICPESEYYQERVVKDLTNAGWTFEGYGQDQILDEELLQDEPNIIGCVEMLFRRE